MRCVQITGPNQISVDTIPDPQLQKNEVLLKPVLGGICGTDIHILKGSFTGGFPIVPCHEIAAVVLDLNGTESGFSTGDLVTVDPNIRCGSCEFCQSGRSNLCRSSQAVGVTRNGGFAELLAVPSSHVHPLRNAEPGEAAFCEPLACVLYGLKQLNLNHCRQALVWGAGAIGLLHAQILQYIYDIPVTITDRLPERLGAARSIGIMNTVKSQPGFHHRLHDICPNGWPISVEATGNHKVIESLLAHLGPGGQALIFGVYDHRKSSSFSPFDVFQNNWKIMGSLTYHDEFSDAVNLTDSGKLSLLPLISQTIELSNLPETLQKMAAGYRPGKIQVTV